MSEWVHTVLIPACVGALLGFAATLALLNVRCGCCAQPAGITEVPKARTADERSI
jgi:hypothetical protein